MGDLACFDLCQRQRQQKRINKCRRDGYLQNVQFWSAIAPKWTSSRVRAPQLDW